MKVAVIGASGRVGSRLIAELIARGHEVRGIARQPAETGVAMVVADANDRAALAAAIRGCDALMVAGRFVSMHAATILGALADAGVPRLLVVGGAGSLFVAPGLQLIDAPGMPVEFLPEVSAGKSFLETLQASDADWTFLSPAAQFGPGERTGVYRLGGDDLMRDAKGESRISFEDLAKALVDELEEPRHRRKRFSIAY